MNLLLGECITKELLGSIHFWFDPPRLKVNSLERGWEPSSSALVMDTGHQNGRTLAHGMQQQGATAKGHRWPSVSKAKENVITVALT
jgi:hypothetical protein